MGKLSDNRAVKLPVPAYSGICSLENALFNRRSVREFKSDPLSLQQVNQLLWAAQGITDARNGFRTAPSAGALYPLQLYLAAGNVTGLPAGVYQYLPENKEIVLHLDQDVRSALSRAALEQDWMSCAAIYLIIAAKYEKTMHRYGQRGRRYVDMEAGHVAQNIHLQASALDLGTVVVGAFNDEQVQGILKLPPGEQPVCIMPVGYQV